jgi:glycosyltransferase involved in cell wall biosynthesis
MVQCVNATAQSPSVVLDVRVITESGGGPDKTILNSPRYFAQTSYKNLCAYLHPQGEPGFQYIRQKAEALQAPLLAVPDRGPLDWRVLTSLVKICRQHRVNIWHGHDYKSNALGLLVQRFWPMRLVSTVHGWVKETPRLAIYYKIDKLSLRFYDAVICVSADLRTTCLNAGVQPQSCYVVENGIDIDCHRRTSSIKEAKKRQGFSPDRMLIGAVGRLSAEKGFNVLIASAHQLVEQGVDLEVCIVGEGSEKQNLQRLSKALGVDNRIHFLGFVSNPIDVYEAMDAFVLCSLREGLPNVLLEALALEVPVVATRIAGVPNVIADGENGLMVAPGNQDELCQALRRLLKDQGLRDNFGKAGRLTVEGRFSFAKRMQIIHAIYDKVLSKNACGV